MFAPCACHRPQLNVQASCARQNLSRGGVSQCASKSAYLGNRLALQRYGRISLPNNSNISSDTCQFRRKVTVASVFGVGAPEAIVVGVVALVVFGPKGLADAAKSLGKSLRGFAPTIRELAGVSNELKQTLEQEIGLDEIRREWRDGSYPPYRQDPATSSNRLDSNAQATTSQSGNKAEASDSQPNKANSPDASASKVEASDSDAKPLKEISEDLAKQVDPSIEAKRAESARLAWGDTSSTSNALQPAHQAQEEDKAPRAELAATPTPNKAEPSFDGMTVEQLEAELARRRAKQPSHSNHK